MYVIEYTSYKDVICGNHNTKLGRIEFYRSRIFVCY